MKRSWFFCIILSISLALQSTPVGNTAAPQLLENGFFIPSDCWIDLRIGYEGDFVGDGRLKQIIEGSGRVDGFQQYTNMATATLNILDRLDLFGVFGSSRACANWRFDFAEMISRVQTDTFYHFLWGLGGRGILLEWGAVCLGLGGRYSRVHYRPLWLTINGVPENVGRARMQWRQWQFDLDLSYKIDLLTPYLGVKYSRAHAKIGPFSVPISSNGSGTDHFVSKTPVGLFIGCSLSNGSYFMLNVEGRFFDEDAVTISGDLRF